MRKFQIHTRRTRRGIVFMLAVVSMAVMMVTGTSFLGMAAYQYGNAQRNANAVKALALAEAGVNYAIWDRNSNTTPESGDLPTSLPDPRTLRPDGSLAPTWKNKSLSDDATGKYNVWLATYTKDSAQGFEVISIGKSGGYSRAIRAVFEAKTYTDTTSPGSSTGGTDPGSVSGDIRFDHTLLTDSDLKFDSDCAIGGNVAVNGNLTMDNSGRFVKINGNGGNVNVSGNLAMTGNARIEGTTNVHGSVSIPNGSPKILGSLNALGTLQGSYNGTVNNATVNGNVTVSGLGLTGVTTTAGNFQNSGWNSQIPSSVLYAGTYKNTGISSYNSISHQSSVTPLPSSTGTAVNMEEHRVNIDAWKPTAFSKTYSTGYSVNNGSPQLTDSNVNINGDWKFSGGPNIMTIPPNANIYVSGNFNTACNTTFNATDVVLYVKGDINIAGTFNFNGAGKVIIAAEGAINIGGGYNFGNTKVTLLSKKSITLGRNTPIYATMYVHNSANTGTLTINSTDIHGAAICDKAVFTGSGNTFDYVSPSYPADPTGGIPGGETPGSGTPSTVTNTDWRIASWELLY